MIIAIIGGTGKEGKGLAYRWAKAGHQVIIGSRQDEKAKRIVSELKDKYPEISNIRGEANPIAAKQADLIVITVPFKGHIPTLESIYDACQGKVVVDVTVPLVPPKVSKVHIPEKGSAAQESQEILGENVQVVSAFQNVSFENLLKDDGVECDVLVCGNNKEAKQKVIGLVEEAGMRGLDAGPIENSIVSEGLTSVLIHINKQFGIHSSGIKITGID